MNLIETCEAIKSLIREIDTTHQELEKITQESEIKAREAVAIIRESVKEFAPLYIKYSRTEIGQSYQDKRIIWHKEYGLAMKSRSSAIEPEPLVVIEGDFPVETLVTKINSQLQSVLNTIQRQKNQTSLRKENLEQLINCLKTLE